MRLKRGLMVATALLLAPPALGQAAPEAQWQALNAGLAGHERDADYNYRLGIAALDAGHVPEAIVALQRVLALQPDHAQARAEIARAYVLAGDVDTARAQFDTVLADPTLPDPVRQRFTRLVSDLDRRISGKGDNLSGFVDLSGGYDSNINSATNLTQMVIPLFAVFGPGQLSGSARAMRDGFVDGEGGVSVVSGVGRNTRVFASVLGAYRGYFDNHAFNQGSVTGTIGLAKTLPNHDTVSLSGEVQQFWLGDASYRQTYAAIGQYTHLLPGGKALSFNLQYARLLYDHQPNYDAHHMAASVSLVTRRVVLTADGGYEATRGGSTQSNRFADVSIATEQPLGKRAALTLAAAAGLRDYDKTDVLFLTKRNDQRIDLSAGLKLAVTPRLSLRPRLTWTRNFSNIALYDTERWTAAAGLRLEF